METKTREEYKRMTDVERKRELADFLNMKFIEYQVEKRRRVSQKEWTNEYLGVTAASLSNWMLKSQLPRGTNVFALAAKLGPEIYDILGQPRRVSDNPKIQRLNEIYPTLCKEKQKEIDAIIDSAPEGDRTTARAQAQ